MGLESLQVGGHMEDWGEGALREPGSSMPIPMPRPLYFFCLAVPEFYSFTINQ